MQVCTIKTKEYEHPRVIEGHIYGYGSAMGDIYFCGSISSHFRLFNLRTGKVFSNDSTFGDYIGWVDLTDEYCVKERM